MYITKERYQSYLKLLKEKNEQLIKLVADKKELLQNTSGFEEKQYAGMSLDVEIQLIKNEIDGIHDILNDAVVVERNKEIDDVVDLGDRFTVEFEDGRRESFKLVSTFMEPGEASLSSPIGKDIYKKKLGDSGEYKVGKRTFRYTIVGLENAQDAKTLEIGTDAEPQL